MKLLQIFFWAGLVLHFCSLNVFASQLLIADQRIDKTDTLLLAGSYLPDFTGEYYKNACRSIEAYGWRCKIVWENTSDERMNNRVLHTYPRGKSGYIRSGQTITIYVGNYRPPYKPKEIQERSAQEITIPDLVGMNYEAACSTLKRQNLQCMQQSSYKQGFQGYHGTVFQQNPRAGAKVPKGSAVYIRWYTKYR